MSDITANTSPEAPSETPRHVAIIMDGNGRWARQRSLPRFAGHRAGVGAVRQTVQGCAERHINVLTLFAFSSENWRRPKKEVGLLMELFLSALEHEADKLHRNNVRMRVIGDRTAFAPKLQDTIRAAEDTTRNNSGLVLNIAANYGGRWDITQAVRQLAEQAEQGKIRSADITPAHVQAALCMADLPEPDLFIRTGGEQRISNFLLWPLAYTELYFTPTLWPDFKAQELDAALKAYAFRQRRFGRTGEQIERLRDA